MSGEQNEETTKIKLSSELKQEGNEENKNLIEGKKVNRLFNLEKSTLNEPVTKTLFRDLYRIFLKIKYILNPFLKNEDKKFLIYDWDLWGPLLFTIFLSLLLAIHSENKGGILILVFGIFWLGGLLLYLNANFLGVSM